MKVRIGEGKTKYGPGVTIDLSGDEVATAIVAWLVASVQSLDGITLAERCRLYGLTSVQSLNGLTLAEGCGLGGYLPWPITYSGDGVSIGCERLRYDMSVEDIHRTIRKHRAEEHTNRILEVWRLGKQQLGKRTMVAEAI